MARGGEAYAVKGGGVCCIRQNNDNPCLLLLLKLITLRGRFCHHAQYWPSCRGSVSVIVHGAA